MVFTHFLGQPISAPERSFEGETQPEPPLVQLEALPSSTIASYVRGEAVSSGNCEVDGVLFCIFFFFFK